MATPVMRRVIECQGAIYSSIRIVPRTVIERRVSTDGAATVVRIVVERTVAGDGVVVVRTVVECRVSGDGAVVVRTVIERRVAGDGDCNSEREIGAIRVIERQVHNSRRASAVSVARCTQNNAIAASRQGRSLRSERIARPPVS